MALPVLPNTWRVAWNWLTNAGQHAVNVLHVTSNLTSAPAIAAVMTANWQTNQFWSVSNDASIQSMDFIKLDGVSGTVNVDITDHQGEGGTEYMPGVAALITARTGLRGAAHRGRMYLPFQAENRCVDGLLVTGGSGAYTTAWEAWRTALIGGNVEPTVASYVHGTATGISRYAGESVLATQRRRQSRLR